jgi:uncharacterized membrane protein YciS (DUF1049 family)
MERLMRIFTYLISLILIVLGVTFACLNFDETTVNLYWVTKTLPLALLVAITFAVGGVLGVFVSLFILVRQKARYYALAKKMSHAEKALQDSKNNNIEQQ